MHTNIITTAAALSDNELLARLPLLARIERDASVELVAHLAVLDTRPALYAAEGYGSLFSYCTQALRLSEDAACNRIEAARACRRFPSILELLASGALSLTSIRLLGKHLTQENHAMVLARAANRSRREIEALVAELAPRPDVPSLVRRLPSRSQAAPSTQIEPSAGTVTRPANATALSVQPPATAATAAVTPPPPSAPRPVVQALAPARYRVQFTLGEEAHQRLRKLQTLLRREIPDGDPGAIVDCALILLLAKVERKKLGAATRPRAPRPIRPGTDRHAAEGSMPPRDPSSAVIPYALRGEAARDNSALRCRRHTQHEAELVFGSEQMDVARRGARSQAMPATTAAASKGRGA